MPIKTSESKFELEPYGISQMIIIFSALIFTSILSVIAGILLKQYQGSWFLYIFAGVIFIFACILFGIRYQKIRAGDLETITINVEGIKKHSKKAGTIKFLSWDDDLNFSISEEQFMDDELVVSYPSVILITGKNESLDIKLEEYTTVLVKADKIMPEFELAFKNFKKKHRKLSK